MLNQQTIEKLYAMRMRGMADAFTQQQEDPQTTQLSFEERIALLVDRQWNWRQNRALELMTAPHTCQRLGRYTVAVKVIDIFGNDTMTLVPVFVG